MAAPWISVERGQILHHSCAEGIEVDVADEFQEVGLLLDEDGLVAVLEEMPDATVSAVKGARVAREEGPHGHRQRPGARTHEEVGVVREEHPGKDAQARRVADRCQPAHELRPVRVIAEDGLPGEPPHHHVVQGPRRIEARPAEHVRRLAAWPTRVKQYLS
jgi:hypothetical protein